MTVAELTGEIPIIRTGEIPVAREEVPAPPDETTAETSSETAEPTPRAEEAAASAETNGSAPAAPVEAPAAEPEPEEPQRPFDAPPERADWPRPANGELVSALDGNWPALEKEIGAKLEAATATVLLYGVKGKCRTPHSTVTLLARLRGLSTSVPRAQAVW